MLCIHTSKAVISNLQTANAGCYTGIGAAPKGANRKGVPDPRDVCFRVGVGIGAYPRDLQSPLGGGTARRLKGVNARGGRGANAKGVRKRLVANSVP